MNASKMSWSNFWKKRDLEKKYSNLKKDLFEFEKVFIFKKDYQVFLDELNI
jgi:hypothetical protein